MEEDGGGVNRNECKELESLALTLIFNARWFLITWPIRLVNVIHNLQEHMQNTDILKGIGYKS